MQNKLKEALESKVLVFDGAMGTEIYRRNFSCISCAIIGKSPDHYV